MHPYGGYNRSGNPKASQRVAVEIERGEQDVPLVSVVIPMRDEERFIGCCLESVLANDYPRDRLEVLVVDGISRDRSREVVEGYARQYSGIRIITNPQRIQAAAINRGIREARGEAIIRMDAHTTYLPDYIRQCVTLLRTAGAANVGGVQRAVGTGYVGSAIAVATTSPFGAGDARFRYSDREEWVDSVYLGAWYKQTLESVGGFNEDWVANEDYELNYRLRKTGGKILLSPKIRCHYEVRGSLSALARQYFRYGFWKVRTLVAHPDSLRWRHIVPPALLLALLASSGLLLVYWPAGVVVPGLYLVASLAAAFGTAHRRGWRYFPLLPLVFGTLHVSNGAGFWAGVVRFGVPSLSFRCLAREIYAAVQAFRPWSSVEANGDKLRSD